MGRATSLLAYCLLHYTHTNCLSSITSILACLADIIHTDQHLLLSAMAQVVIKSLWDAQLAHSGHFDKIIVQNLEVTANAGKDVWGRPKMQRALLSVTVTLKQHFESASKTDTVDASTIHYGTLSKAVQADVQGRLSNWVSSEAMATNIVDSVKQVAGSTPLYAVDTDICYLKGSMFGAGAGYRTSRFMADSSGPRSNVLYLRDVRIPCLIGVNANERLQKQPVVINIWIECIDTSRADDHAPLETFLFQVGCMATEP